MKAESRKCYICGYTVFPGEGELVVFQVREGNVVRVQHERCGRNKPK